jgi:hypothetical protein
MDKDTFEHEIRNASMGVALEVQRIRMAMQRLETHLQRMDQACLACKELEKTEQELIDQI